MKPAQLLIAALLVVSSAPAAVLAEVVLQADQRDNLGIRTEPVQFIDAARSWPASAQVLDVAPLISTLSDLQSAETAATASRSEAERTARLYQDDTNVARKALEAAHAQETADQGRVTTTKAQLLATWGRAISAMAPAERARLVEDLLKGKASLVRAEQIYTLPAGAHIAQVHLTALNGSGNWPAQWLGPLPQTNGATLVSASLLRVAAELAPGQLLTATLTLSGAGVRGASVPTAAIIRWHGAEWVYEETSANHFSRREVQAATHIEGRALIDGNAAANRNVVVVGARALLGAEQGASEAQDGAAVGE